ncbi:Arc family DNA-binding protein [Chromobacterium violaceum]|uniref:Arc family DNA-binding protein n=1 Tax=Chromobacterium violaceum TaxID=536 RepID=UPI0015951FF2|nr:Arc family DNA-binding protein [Chromobacterium violaceum]
MKEDQNYVWRTQIRFPKKAEDWVKRRAESQYRSANSVLLDLVLEEMRREEEQLDKAA